jgi:hypothetical protein
MQIRFDASALRETKWHQYATRFILGGLITGAAGLIATKFGPVVGGLFLAFPAIFPASATLVENHEKEKKEKLGMAGAVRGRKAASLDAAGTAIGSVGLAVFALLVWRFLPTHHAWGLLLLGTTAWLAVSLLLWQIRKHASRFRRKRHLTFGTDDVQRQSEQK